jgi:hypothetical protein
MLSYERTPGMADPTTEFCPKCGTPVDTSGDETRLCDACGWFGDNTETAKTPPDTGNFNPVLAAVQGLTLFRDVCRHELMVEQVYVAGNATRADLRKVKTEARNALHCMVEMFTALRRPHAAPPTVLKRDRNGLVPWPAEWAGYHYNARKEPCDVLVGPCSCGAWHTETEDWVREALARHNAVIQ